VKYLLDTNICIYFLNQRSKSLIHNFNSLNPKDISVCSVVKAELFYGALKSGNPQKNMQKQR